MADDLARRVGPLGALAAMASTNELVTLTELPPATRLSLRAEGDAVGALSAAVGVQLPTDRCRASSSGERRALWLGPDEWLLLVPESDTALARAGEGVLASVVDISHRQTAIAVAGPKAAEAINAFCALDLHLSAFAVGMCTRTLLGKAEIVLWRLAAEAFRIEVGRSFAPYVWRCLEEARMEYMA